MRTTLLHISVFLFLIPGALLAQQSEVRVVKPYSPTLSGADKIQLLPSMDEEIRMDPPEFTYQLYPKRYESRFRVEPIRAARMIKPPLKKLYKSELTAGAGNYLTPLAELRINQLRSRDGSLGITARHHSMNGKLKLNDELKVPAGFSENSIEVQGNRFFRNAALEFLAAADYTTHILYGVDTTLVNGELQRDSLKQPFFLAEGGLRLYSTHADSMHFNYDASLGYHYFTHRFDEAEHGARLDFGFHKKLRVLDLAGDAGAAYYLHPADWDTLVGNHLMVWLNPRIAKSSSEWRFSAGVNAYLSFINGEGTVHIYPRGSFEFHVVREVIVPYFGVNGYLESNHYRDVAEENPYVVPTLSLRPTSHRLIGYAGLKGRITRSLSYRLRGSYSIIDDQYFFVNDTTQELKNQFSVVYSDITLLNLRAEVAWSPSDAWKLFLKGNYYQYTLSTMQAIGELPRSVREDDHPWNKPAFDLSLQARYNLRDKILVDMGIYTIGKRFYEDFNPTTEEILPLTVDANLGIEYRYTHLLSFWARINNLAAQRYFLYHQYPSYRFRAMLGFTYSL